MHRLKAVPPTFCRHNRFIENCPICRPQPEAQQAPKPRATRGAAQARARTGAGSAARPGRSGAVRVRRMVQAADDGYRCDLVIGLKASADAERLADELAFATARLAELAADPPALYAEIGAEPDAEEAIWLAFLTAYLQPTQDSEPFAAIRAAHVPWASGELPDFGVARGPRTSHDPATGERTILAYRAWAQRAGGQKAAFAGESSWTPERRFDRLFERLALPGFTRAGRYELLTSLGRLGVADLRASSLQFTDDATTIAAKRVFGIGDKLLLERRAHDLAQATDVPIEALDLALYNWGATGAARATMGSGATVSSDERDAIAAALGI
jgi:hypothetical protein